MNKVTVDEQVEVASTCCQAHRTSDESTLLIKPALLWATREATSRLSTTLPKDSNRQTNGLPPPNQAAAYQQLHVFCRLLSACSGPKRS